MTRSAQEWIALATAIPARPLNVALHEYIDNVRTLVNGADPLNIPASHRTLMAAENHEGSARLNTRIRQLATWFSRGEARVRAVSSGPGQTVQRGASAIERFVRQGEIAFARGTPLHHWQQECDRDLAEVGFSVYLQTPRKDYYDTVEADPSQMAKGSLLADVALRRRIDPRTFSFEERIGGRFRTCVIESERNLGDLALRIGVDSAKMALDTLQLSEAIDESDSTTWSISVNVAEVWADDGGALVYMGAGNGAQLKTGVATVGDVPAESRVLSTWENATGHPPFYAAFVGPRPVHSPLDEMIQRTNARNYWATMLDIQASGAIYRHWQLIDNGTGDDMTNKLYIGRENAPEHLLYDISKPPPDMGPETEWKLAPFEMHDVVPRYTQIRDDHESAGASVARLSGQAVNQNTPVGTADFIDDAARAEFGDWVEAKEKQAALAWYDWLCYHRDVHKDPVFVVDKQRDTDNDPTVFLSTTTSLSAAEIVTETVEITYDMRSRLSKIADYRLFTEMRNNGDMDYRTGVELGYVPGVEDGDAEIAAIVLAERERIHMETRLHQAQQEDLAAMNAQVSQDRLAPPPAPLPNVVGGARTDPRGTGTQRGPNNISDSALAAGATDLNRGA